MIWTILNCIVVIMFLFFLIRERKRNWINVKRNPLFFNVYFCLAALNAYYVVKEFFL